MGSRLPALGPRGEGWVVGQLVLFGVIAVAGLLELAGHEFVSAWGPVVSLGGGAAILAGGFVAARGVWDLRASLSPFPRPIAGAPLVESGAYRLIRHPIYSGLVLGAIGWALVTGSLVVLGAIGWALVTGSLVVLGTAGLLFLLFAGKSRREEAWLVDAHPGYRAYQQRTKRLIPWVF